MVMYELKLVPFIPLTRSFQPIEDTAPFLEATIDAGIPG
jgi:hypothetical protein